MIKLFEGRCRLPDNVGGGWTEPVHLKDEQAAVRYCNLQKILFPEVRIMDSDDYVVLHAVDGKIVFPPAAKEA